MPQFEEETSFHIPPRRIVNSRWSCSQPNKMDGGYN